MSASQNSQRSAIIHSIETTMLEVVQAISENRFPVLVKSTLTSTSEIDLGRSASRKKFTILLQIMSKAYYLTRTDTVMKKRDLYYENPALYGSQKNVQDYIDDLHAILQVPQGSLPFVSCPKGLMACGENTRLTWKSANDQGETPEETSVIIDKTGTLVPDTFEIQNWGVLESNAKFILIVEKDAVFHRVLQEDIFSKLEPFILLTGKGYPDMATRKVACKLSRDLNIPTFALIDGNPHGFEIAAIYKWGAYEQEQYLGANADLVVPSLKLIGLLATDFEGLTLPEDFLLPFSTPDKKKLESLIKRFKDLENRGEVLDEMWMNEAAIFEEHQKKAEIESMASLSNCFITDSYLRPRINSSLSQSQRSQ